MIILCDDPLPSRSAIGFGLVVYIAYMSEGVVNHHSTTYVIIV